MLKRLKKELNPMTKSNIWVPLVLASFLLLIGASVITAQNITQYREILCNGMADRGTRNLLFYEATVIHNDTPPDPHIRKNVIESFVSQVSFKFITVTDVEGRILAHIEPQNIGKQLEFTDCANPQHTYSKQFEGVLPNIHEKGSRWGLTKVDGAQYFVVGRISEVLWKRTHGKDELGNVDGSPQTVHLILGFDSAPLDESMERFWNILILITLWIFAVGILLLGVFTLIAKNRATRKKIIESKRALAAMDTEVQRLVKQVGKQEKVAALGNFVAGIAHEIRNPLSTLKGYATYFKQVFPRDSEGYSIATIMVGETERLNRVVGDLIGISKPSDISKQKVSLKRVVESIMELLAQDAKQQGIKMEIFGNDQMVEIDPDRFRQVLLNICLNAFEMFEEMTNTNGSEDHHVCFEIHDTEMDVLLKIIDNGSGMPPEILERIFDIYFTTKNVGVGLGLTNVQNIMDAHNGFIQVTSELGKGTCFTLYIPKKTVGDASDD